MYSAQSAEQDGKVVSRSFVIPVLSIDQGNRYNILTLLKDLEHIDGEVICIFNSSSVFDRMRYHSRIDKFCYNKDNASVSRSWNMGINLAESDTVFVLNADLHLQRLAVLQMEHYLYQYLSMSGVFPVAGTTFRFTIWVKPSFETRCSKSIATSSSKNGSAVKKGNRHENLLLNHHLRIHRGRYFIDHATSAYKD